MASRFRFRAWDDKRKVMVLNPFQDADDGEEIYFANLTEDGDLNWGAFDDNLDWYELKVMQSTGLTDSKGVEIFDGDVIRFTSRLFVVTWNKSGLSWMLCADDDRSFFSSFNGDLWLHSTIRTYEVIGNIYQDSHALENPEPMEANQ